MTVTAFILTLALVGFLISKVADNGTAMLAMLGLLVAAIVLSKWPDRRGR